MRLNMIIVPLALVASPALAAPVQVPPQLSDPAVANRLTDVMHAMSSALLNLPIGEIEAAAQGRAPTPADRTRTVRSETGLNEAELGRQIDGSRVAIQQGMKAMAVALPKIAGAIEDAKRQMETATANMPRPDYPKR
jgi:hypothetical protein